MMIIFLRDMKCSNILSVVLTLALFSALPANSEAAPLGKTDADNKLVYYEGQFVKFYPGKRKEALSLIYDKFWSVDRAIGRKAIPFDLVTGEWDHIVFFRLHGGLADMELEKAEMRVKWSEQLEKQEGGPEKSKQLLDYVESLIMKRGGGLFKVPASVVDFDEDYFNEKGKPSYHTVSFIKFKSGKKAQATELALKNFLPVSRSVVSSVIPMISIAGRWDHIVFKKMPNGIEDPESESISKPWSEEFIKQQGSEEKAAQAMKFWNNNLLQEKVTEIAKALWKK